MKQDMDGSLSSLKLGEVTEQQKQIDVIEDVLALAEERLGEKKTFTREEAQRLLIWAAHAAYYSAEMHEVAYPEARRAIAGNMADGRDDAASDYPPVPLFENDEGEKHD